MTREDMAKVVTDGVCGQYANDVTRAVIGALMDQALAIYEPMLRSQIIKAVEELRAADERFRLDALDKQHGALADAFTERLGVYDDVVRLILDVTDA